MSAMRPSTASTGWHAVKTSRSTSSSIMIERVLESVCKPLLMLRQLAGNLFMLLCEHAAAPQRIDRAPIRCLHQPRPRIVRDAFLGPNFKSSHERILRQFLGNADIEGDAAIAAMRRVDSIFHTASIVLWTSLK